MDYVIKGWQFHLADHLGDKAVFSFIATVFAIISFLCYVIKTKDLPPGPVGFPVLGIAPFLKDQTCHHTVYKLQKKYGDIFSFNFAGTLYISMGSVKAIREIHIAKADFFERVSDYSLLSYIFADGVSLISGEPWKVLRKFTLQQFRELGMTTIKDNTGETMYDSIKETIEFLKSMKGEPVEIIQLLTDRCNTILRQVMFADCGITEQEIREINVSFGPVLSLMTVKNLLYAGDFSRYFILPFKPGYKEAMKHFKIINKLLLEIVNDHKLRFNEEHPRNFISAYFKERNERRSRGDPTAKYFTDKALVATLLQFVGDGVLTTAVFVSLFLKYIVDHEEEQDKIYLS